MWLKIVVGLFILGVLKEAINPSPKPVRQQAAVRKESSKPENETGGVQKYNANGEVVTSEESSPKSRSAYIPDLAAVDIHGNLTNRGFSLEKNLSGEYGSSWMCTKEANGYEFSVEVWGEGPTQIKTVTTNIRSLEGESLDEEAVAFLGYIATTPYKDAEPVRAREWVEANYDNNKATTVIGRVKYTIYAPTAFARILSMETAR